MLPESENAKLRWDAVKAVEIAEAGHVRGGCAHLVEGLARARRLQRAGVTGAAELVARYEI